MAKVEIKLARNPFARDDWLAEMEIEMDKEEKNKKKKGKYFLARRSRRNMVPWPWSKRNFCPTSQWR